MPLPFDPQDVDSADPNLEDWMRKLQKETWDDDFKELRFEMRRDLTKEEWETLVTLCMNHTLFAEMASGFETPNPCVLLIQLPNGFEVSVHPDQIPAPELDKSETGTKMRIKLLEELADA